MSRSIYPMFYNYRALNGEIAEIYQNCTLWFEDADNNENGYIGFHETLKNFATIGIFGFSGNKLDIVKSNQINCTACLSNLTLY